MTAPLPNQPAQSGRPLTGPALNRPASPAAKADEGIGELVNLLFAIWQRKVIVVFVAGLCLLASAVYCFRTTPLYRAMATIEVAPQEQTVIHIEDVNKLALNQLDVLNTLVLKSTRDTVLSRVVKMNNLTQYPAFMINGVACPEPAAVAQIAGSVKSALRRNTRLIDITAIHSDPQVAQLLANGVATQFIRQEVEDQGAGTRFANVSLLEEAARLKGELERSERLLQAYREQNKTVSLEDRQNIVDQKLHSLAQQLNDVRADQTQIVSQQEQANALTNNPEELLALPAIKSDAVVAGLQSQIAQQETLVNFYATRYKEKYPKMIEARQRLEELKRSVITAALAACQTLESVAEAAHSKEQGLEHAVADAEQQSLALSRLAIDYNILQRDMESNRSLYQAILQRLKETEVSKGIEKTSLQIIESAGLPNKPFKPNRPLLLVMGLFGGLVLGVGLALLLAQLDQTLKSPEDAERKLGVPVVGLLTFDQPLAKSDAALVMSQPGSILAEGFRTLRANVALSARSSARQVILFTSPGAKEGKTMSASNYAVTLAQQNLRTVIVDLDLRRPQLEKTFGLKPGLPGVSDFLLGQARLEDIVYASGVEKLTVVPAGRTVPNPSEQLAGPWLPQLLKALRERYDVVVLDTAPVNPISDTLSFAEHADMILLVICGRHTHIKAAQRACLTLERAGRRPAGLVLNRMTARQSYYKYDYVYAKELEVQNSAAT
jgi:polysaccharide biosynthesis transport protein